MQTCVTCTTVHFVLLLLFQWQSLGMTVLDMVHILLFLLAFCMLIGSLGWLLWLLVSDDERAIRERESELAFVTYCVYGPLDILCFFIVILELKFTIIPLVRRWKLQNMHILILNNPTSSLKSRINSVRSSLERGHRGRKNSDLNNNGRRPGAGRKDGAVSDTDVVTVPVVLHQDGTSCLSHDGLSQQCVLPSPMFPRFDHRFRQDYCDVALPSDSDGMIAEEAAMAEVVIAEFPESDDDLMFCGSRNRTQLSSDNRSGALSQRLLDGVQRDSDDSLISCGSNAAPSSDHTCMNLHLYRLQHEESVMAGYSAGPYNHYHEHQTQYYRRQQNPCDNRLQHSQNFRDMLIPEQSREFQYSHSDSRPPAYSLDNGMINSQNSCGMTVSAGLSQSMSSMDRLSDTPIAMATRAFEKPEVILNNCIAASSPVARHTCTQPICMQEDLANINPDDFDRLATLVDFVEPEMWQNLSVHSTTTTDSSELYV